MAGIVVSPDELRRQTAQLLKQVNAEMEKYEDEANLITGSPFDVQNRNGHCGYGELVQAKMTALNTLALLNNQVKR